MAHKGEINWEGYSGEKYKYYIYDIGTDFEAVQANYIFIKETKPDTFEPIYIGQTGDISERFDNHHKIECIREHGATHICTHKSSSDEKVRKKEESDLIEKWPTPCNER